MHTLANIWQRARTFRDFYKIVFPFNRFYSGERQLRLWAGPRVWVRTPDHIAIFQNIFAKDEYQLWRLRDLVRQGQQLTVIDLGAHIGAFSLRIKQMWPDARVRAYEADADNFALLTKNVAKNIQGVELHNLAVSTHEGTVQFSPDGSSGSITSHGGVSVQSVALESIMRGEHIDLVKMDIEGEEYKIFESIPEECLLRIRALYIEIHHWKFGGDKEPVLRRLKDFSITYINPDLILARRITQD